MKILLFMSIIFLALLTAMYYLPKPPLITEGMKKDCSYGANLAKEGFKGTEFEDWNFYQSCITNIICSNPAKSCPVKEIYQETKDWGKQ